MSEILDLTPTDEGYRNMVAMFVDQIIESARKDRREAVAGFLISINDIATYFASKGTQSTLDQRKAFLATVKDATRRHPGTQRRRT